MDVVWHDHESMQDVMPKGFGVVLNRFHKHVRKGWLAKVCRARAEVVQQSVHGGECLSRRQRSRREGAVGGQTVREPPCEEDRPSRLRNMRKPPPGEGHYGNSRLVAENSHLYRVDLWGQQPSNCQGPRFHFFERRAGPGGPAQTRGSAPQFFDIAARGIKWAPSRNDRYAPDALAAVDHGGPPHRGVA